MAAASPIRLTDTLRSHESASDTARRLDHEARQHARAAGDALRSDLDDIRARCADLATLQPLPAGERDILAKLADRIEGDLNTIQAIGARAS